MLTAGSRGACERMLRVKDNAGGSTAARSVRWMPKSRMTRRSRCIVRAEGAGIIEKATEVVRWLVTPSRWPFEETSGSAGATASTAAATADSLPAAVMRLLGFAKDKKSDAYSAAMQSKMGGGLTYVHEAGMNYARVLPDLYVGSCLQTAADVDSLYGLGVGTVLCLQEDSDMAYFALDIAPIRARAEALSAGGNGAVPGGPPNGRISHLRVPTRDFDPHDLRLKLPTAVGALYRAEMAGAGAAYVHCTAGLGRAPATAVAYMVWCKGFDLSEAYARLYAVRECHPKLAAIRQATVDLLRLSDAETTDSKTSDSGSQSVLIVFPRLPGDPAVEVAGLDVGWGNRLPLALNARLGRLELRRSLPPGKYPFKFVVGGSRWTFNADLPRFVDDGGNENNYAEVAPPETEAQRERRERLLSAGGKLTAPERAAIQQQLRAMPPPTGGGKA